MSAVGLEPIAIDIAVSQGRPGVNYSDIEFCTTRSAEPYICPMFHRRQRSEPSSPNTANLTGRVIDPGGQLIGGAMLLFSGMSRTYDAITDDDGTYSVKDIHPGSYDVKVVRDATLPSRRMR
jgi:protocatechuate 3,4-dioxygenase beta subunit